MTQAEPASQLAYDSDDLAFFDNVLDNLVEELAGQAKVLSRTEAANP